MMALGIAMMAIYAHLYFAPWKRFRRAVAASDWPGAAKELGQIRRIVAVNLALGLVTVLIGASGRYIGYSRICRRQFQPALQTSNIKIRLRVGAVVAMGTVIVRAALRAGV